MGWTVEQVRTTDRAFLVRLGVIFEQRREREAHEESMARIRKKK
ncbi:MAG: hypothetical protein ABFD77_01230 [Thermotogota bacterium]